MTLEVAINLNSLKMVKEELDNSITQAATEFEIFFTDQSDQTHIELSIAALAQIAGTFRLLEYPGAALLADELAAAERVIADQTDPISENLVNAVTHNLFVLPRYLEYVTIRQMALPILLIPYINELRIARKTSLLPEYHFYSSEFTKPVITAITGSPQLSEVFKIAPRLRHMYQLGLLGVISDKKHSPHFGELMLRAVKRISDLLIGHPSSDLWLLVTGFICCISTQSLEITLNRKRMLGVIEKLFRQVVTQGEPGLVFNDEKTFKQDLLFAIALSACSDPIVKALKKAYGLTRFDLDDSQLAAERVKMYGPSANTMESVIKGIKEEIRLAKDILEIASQNNSMQNDDTKSLEHIISRVADTLSMLNLSGPMQVLIQQRENINQWQAQDQAAGLDYQSVADALLYIEGALSSLACHEVTVEQLNNADEQMRFTIIAKNQLAEAERVVLEETMAGIALSKRAISSYVESNFDTGHIANIAVTLNTLRGGLQVLNYHRAAAVLKSCSAFIQHHINDKNASDQRHQLLETLADALISMEYYLGEVSTSRKVNEKILDIAEESLSALGFSVEPKAVE